MKIHPSAVGPLHSRSRLPALVALTCLLVGLLGHDQALGRSDDRPNIIFIMADDMGVDWVSCYGSNHATPQIDSLAEQGIRFKHVWCNPICTPTRMTLLTGMYPFRTGWTNHHDVPRWGGRGFDWNKYVTWARVLRESGYTTAIGGKWQINDLRNQPDALKLHGFDEHCMWTGFETGNAPPSNERYWNPYLVTNGKRQVHKDQFGPTVINEFLTDFIRRHRDQPFMVYYPMLMPHGPYVRTPLNKDNPPASKPELYAGMVTHLDHLVGNIIKTVDECGLKQRTLIAFTCDNGSSTGGRLNGKPYAKGKGRLLNRGAHVPLVIRAPFLTDGKVGQVRDELIDFSDIYPTFCELARVKPPSGTSLDGRSFVSVLTSTAKPTETRRWIYSQIGTGRMVRDERFLLDNRDGFYDLKADPSQEQVADPAADPAAAEAHKKLSKVLRDLPEDAGPPFARYRKGRANKKQRKK